MTNSNSSENKKLGREEFYHFIGLHYAPQQMKKLKILNLTSDKPYELEQIYDKLGIPRENITTVEKDPKKKQRIKNSNFGIRLIEDYSSIDDFIRDTDEKFDIINIDYSGNMNWQQVITISNIAVKDMLRDRGILATWYSGRRENTLTQRDFVGNYQSIKNALSMIKIEPKRTLPNAERLLSIINEMSQVEEGDIERSESITHAITSNLFYSDPVETRSIPKIIKLIGGERKLIEVIENIPQYRNDMKLLLDYISAGSESKFMEKYKNIEGSQNASDLLKLIKSELGQTMLKYFRNIRAKKLIREEPLFEDRLELAKCYINNLDAFKEMYSITENWIVRELKNKLSPLQLTPVMNHIDSITHILFNQGMKYLVLDNERLFYSGDNGTPMYVDFILAGKKEFKDFSWEVKNGKLKLNIGTLAHFGYREMNRMNDYINMMNKSSVVEMDNRIEIGKNKKLPLGVSSISAIDDIVDEDNQTNTASNSENSSPLISDKEIEYFEKTLIKSLIAEGKSDDEIASIFPNYSKRAITSYRTWQKMKSNPAAIKAGRKKKNTENIEKITEEAIPESKTNNSTSESLSKDDAILLLKEGYSPIEIADTFGINVWRIRGYKAGETRRLNKEKSQYKNAS